MKNKMIYCSRWKLEINPEAECMCLSCIFWHPERKEKCDYKNWKPGLKKGKEW